MKLPRPQALSKPDAEPKAGAVLFYYVTTLLLVGAIVVAVIAADDCDTIQVISQHPRDDCRVLTLPQALRDAAQGKVTLNLTVNFTTTDCPNQVVDVVNAFELNDDPVTKRLEVSGLKDIRSLAGSILNLTTSVMKVETGCDHHLDGSRVERRLGDVVVYYEDCAMTLLNSLSYNNFVLRRTHYFSDPRYAVVLPNCVGDVEDFNITVNSYDGRSDVGPIQNLLDDINLDDGEYLCPKRVCTSKATQFGAYIGYAGTAHAVLVTILRWSSAAYAIPKTP